MSPASAGFLLSAVGLRRFPAFSESRRWIDGAAAKVRYGESIPKRYPRPERDEAATKNPGERMAGYRSGAGRSAMLAVGPVIGPLNGHWRRDAMRAAMHSL